VGSFQDGLKRFKVLVFVPQATGEPYGRTRRRSIQNHVKRWMKLNG
jgi:hypothetical protein